MHRTLLAVSLALSILSPAAGGGCAAKREERQAPVSADRVSVLGTESYWTSFSGGFAGRAAEDDHSATGMFVIKGSLANGTGAELRRVTLQYDLLSADGNTVYTEIGVNRRAEPLLDLAPEEIADLPRDETDPIAPDEQDSFRMLFIGNEIPRFDRFTVRVIAVE